jgi:glycosyltransferase involved in cell wall biosynthesis
MIVIFTPMDSLSGGNYRILNVVKHFPRDKYILAMPENRKKKMIEIVTKYIEGREWILDIIQSAYSLREFGDKGDPWGSPNDIETYIRYGYYVGRVTKELGGELLYFSHESVYLPLGFKLSRVRWTTLLQLTPVVGSLSVEDGSGFTLFLKNMKIHGYGLFKTVKGYIRLRLYSWAVGENPVLAVSASIPYELEKLGIKAHVEVIKPGVGVDPCQYAGIDKQYDVVFFARVTREKGIFDYLKAVKMLTRHKPNLKALVVGLASEKMERAVKSAASELGILHNLELRFNAPRDEALRLIAQSKVMIYPSRLDAFPLAVLETLSCGTPVAAYSIPAIRFNYDTKAVARIKPLDIEGLAAKALEILEHELWKELGREGIEFAKRHNWEDVARAEWKILTSLNI